MDRELVALPCAESAVPHSEPGDRLLLYTDGLTTAETDTGRTGLEPTLEILRQGLPLDNLVERLTGAGVEAVRVGHPARVLPAVLEHTLEERVRAHDQARIAADLVKEALRLRADARKQKQRRGPGRFSEARAQEREARQLLAEARELEDRAQKDVLGRAQVVLATLTGLESRALRGRSEGGLKDRHSWLPDTETCLRRRWSASGTG